METKNYGLKTRQQELEYVRTFTSFRTPDGEINHKRYESLARDLKFMRTCMNIMEVKVNGSPENYNEYECFNGLRSSIECAFDLKYLKNNFYNTMMNELYNITLLTMNDEQYQSVFDIIKYIK